MVVGYLLQLRLDPRHLLVAQVMDVLRREVCGGVEFETGLVVSLPARQRRHPHFSPGGRQVLVLLTQTTITFPSPCHATRHLFTKCLHITQYNRVCILIHSQKVLLWTVYIQFNPLRVDSLVS